MLANTERPGLLALLDVAGLTGKKLTATSIAYSLAPRINAAGRFGSPRQAVELLLCEDPEEAHALADQLEQCNRQRKEVEEQILQEMIAQTEQHPELLQQRVLILAGANWHHGVIGIVAARLEERFGKPAIVTDTHCIRLTNRIGLVDGIKEPKKVEMALWKIIPPEEGSDLCHRLVYHGREICTARTKPYCDRCCLADVCKKVGV